MEDTNIQNQSSHLASRGEKSADQLHKTKISVSGVVFMVFCLVAAGCFGIEEMIPESGPGLSLVLLAIFPLVWALPISEMTAELGSLMPSDGGPYTWARETMGEFWGWQVGFWSGASTWLSQAEYCALVSGYMAKFVEMDANQEYIVRVVMVLVFTIINLIGVKEAEVLDTVFSIIVLVAFAAVAIVGFANWTFNPLDPFYNEDNGVVGSVGSSIAIVIWMYCGYECMSNVSQEVKNPQVIPKGMIVAQPVIAASYIIPTVAAIAAIGSWTMWSTESGGDNVGYADVLINHVGPWAGVAFVIVAVISNCSIFNAYIISGSRAFFVMADEHMFPKIMRKVSKKRGVPHISIIVLAIFTIICCKFSFTALVMAATPLQMYIYILLGVATRRMRKQYPIEERKKKGLFVMHGGKFGLNFMTISPFIIAIIALYCNGTDYFLMGFLLLALGLVLYIIFKLAYKGRVKDDPEEYPLNPKTKLGLGDMINIGQYVFLCGAVAFAGRFILAWYEGDWGAEYYAEENTGIMADFGGMLTILLWLGIGLMVIGGLIWLYGHKTEGEQVAVLKEKRSNSMHRMINWLHGWDENGNVIENAEPAETAEAEKTQ